MNNFNNTDIENTLSYSSIYNLRELFRRSGSKQNLDNDISITDIPSISYFRLFFYFNQGRLLDKSSRVEPEYLQDTREDYITYTTAYNYLLNNLELERAEKLLKFIDLLSSINTYSPWYFSKISGISEALNRKELHEETISEERPSIDIQCLVDPYDSRIGTLLDLYKDICYSKIQHKEILPANLRKFDLGIYVFNTPLRFIHSKMGDTIMDDIKDTNNQKRSDYATLYNSDHKASHKYFELRNCEIELSGINEAYGELNNQDGINTEYKIKLSFDDIYEERYNELLKRTIGDYCISDMKYLDDNGKYIDYRQQTDSGDNKSDIETRITSLRNTSNNDIYENYVESKSTSKIANKTVYSSKFIDNATNKLDSVSKTIENTMKNYSPSNLINVNTNAILSKADNYLNNKLNSIWLGNLYGHSMSNITTSNVSTAIQQGNLVNGWNLIKS